MPHINFHLASAAVLSVQKYHIIISCTPYLSFTALIIFLSARERERTMREQKSFASFFSSSSSSPWDGNLSISSPVTNPPPRNPLIFSAVLNLGFFSLVARKICTVSPPLTLKAFFIVIASTFRQSILAKCRSCFYAEKGYHKLRSPFDPWKQSTFNTNSTFIQGDPLRPPAQIQFRCKPLNNPTPSGTKPPPQTSSPSAVILQPFIAPFCEKRRRRKTNEPISTLHPPSFPLCLRCGISDGGSRRRGSLGISISSQAHPRSFPP